MFASQATQLTRSSRLSFSNELLLFGVYALCHGGILLLADAYFWDDRIIWDASPEFLAEHFGEMGAPWWAYLHQAMMGIGAWSYKTFTFLLFFVSGLALNRILSRQQYISAENRLLIVLLFLVLPFNSTRITNIVFPYTVCYTAFFLGWMLLGRARVLVLTLFLVSFGTNSFLVFYALPIAELFYRCGAFASRTAFIKTLIRNFDFILLPFLFFAAKQLLFRPYGSYDGYNAIKGLSLYVPTLASSIWGMLRFIASEPLFFALLLTPVMLRALSMLGVVEMPQRNGRTLLLLSALALFLGMSPYLLIGLPTHFEVWRSRNQLLMPLGGALLIIGALNTHFTPQRSSARVLKLGLFGTIASASVAAWLVFYGAAFVEWQKQKELIKELAARPELRHAPLILFDDRTEGPLNIEGRGFPSYEWNGVLRAAFRDEGAHRFSLPIKAYSQYLSGNEDKYFSSYRAHKHFRVPGRPPMVVTITRHCDYSPAGCKSFDLRPQLRLEVRRLP